MPHRTRLTRTDLLLLFVIVVWGSGFTVIKYGVREMCALSFGMHVLGNDIVEIPASFLADTGLKVVSLDQLLAETDFVSLNCDLNPTSYHLIGQRELALMKPIAYLITTSRGEGQLILRGSND